MPNIKLINFEHVGFLWCPLPLDAMGSCLFYLRVNQALDIPIFVDFVDCIKPRNTKINEYVSLYIIYIYYLRRSMNLHIHGKTIFPQATKMCDPLN
jgi:hypothetical protein